MDGYHLSRAQLSALPNPQEAHARRGAEFTFDGTSFLTLVRAIRAQTNDPNSRILFAPSFDHATKDPKADDITILPTTKIIVFEGNYLSLDKGPWSTAAALMDELWFVEVDFELARRRLVGRHVRSGVTATMEEAERRVSENDLVNGEEIVRCRVKGIDEVIISKEDDNWKPEAQC
jgi:pantothenate kinase